MNDNLQNQLESEFSNLLPAVSIDCVILGYKNKNLHILILRYKELQKWSLPGGFVNLNQSINEAADQVLKDRTGIEISYLKQLQVFGSVERRDFNVMNKQLETIPSYSSKIKNWFEQRFISVAYLALVNPDSFIPIIDALSDRCEWVPVKEIPNLLLDHNQMVETALDYIKTQIKYQPIGLSLLEKRFTMKTLQNLYEVILNRKLDRGNFQRKMIKIGILNRHEKQMTGAAHKAPYLYSFNIDRYETLLKDGIGFMS